VTATGAVAGVVLAAGFGKRFGGMPKLLAPLGGITLLERALAAYSKARLDDLVLVAAPEPDLGELPHRYGARLVHNFERQAGQSTSLRAGLQALPPTVVGAVVGVADQPFLTPEVIHRLVEEFRATEGDIVVPEYGGRAGSPVVFGRRYFERLERVQGDVGGRSVLTQVDAREVHRVSFADPMLGLDIDTPEDLARAEAYLT
jgi:molybdenum cofactor cytidylyltransferase